MSIQPLQSTNSSNTASTGAIQYQRQSAFSASVAGSIKSSDGSSIDFQFQVQASDAVSVSINAGGAGDAGASSSTGYNSQGVGSEGSGRVHRGRHHRQEQNFKSIDANGDGVLSKEELQSAQQQRQQNGRKTPLIDRALSQFDSLTGQSGQQGITLQQFFARPQGQQPSVPPPAPQATTTGPAPVVSNPVAVTA